jgi:hypothetical protein
VHFGINANANPLVLCCGVLVGIGTITRIASYIFMITFNKGKQA